METLYRILEKIAGLLVSIAATVLAAMMFLMAADVICRYFFNAPLAGGLELVEFMMAILVPLSIAYCAWQRSHVIVDLIVGLLGKGARRGLEIVVTLVSVAFLLAVGWQSLVYIGEIRASGVTSAVLHLPAYPFVVPVAVGILIYGLIMLADLFGGKTRERGDGTD